MTYTPTQAAKLLGVSVTTVQRWSTWFAGHLSAEAAPEPGQRRAFTEADIATFRRAQRMLQGGMTWQQVNSQLAVFEPEEEPEEAPPAGPSSEEHEAQERAQSGAASQALVVLEQQMRIIDSQAGQLADQRAQLTDQAARLREQASQVASQAAELAALRERLARVEEAQRQQERQQARRFRWPWEPREE